MYSEATVTFLRQKMNTKLKARQKTPKQTSPILSSWVKVQGRMLLPQDRRALGTRECHTLAVTTPRLTCVEARIVSRPTCLQS